MYQENLEISIIESHMNTKVYTHANRLIYAHLAMTYRGLASSMYCSDIVPDPLNICNCSSEISPRTQATYQREGYYYLTPLTYITQCIETMSALEIQ